VGLQLTVASTVLVLLVVIAAFAFVFAHLKPSSVFTEGHHQSTIDIGGLDILIVAISIGVVAILLAGLLSWFATRRAIQPLADALRLQRTFVSNASHELRTPLAVLDARLQYLQRGLPVNDPAASTVTELRRDAGTLIQIVNDLLVAAEERGAPVSDGNAVEVEPVLHLAVDSFGILASERKVTVELTAVPTAALAPAASIHRCAVALLDNALRFSPPGSTINVSLISDRGFAEIRVRDQGPGITGIDPQHVFERFARGAGQDVSTGFGIGLAILTDTVTRYGGSASVETTGPSGTTMLVRLPRPRRK
jgi:signal transduction histidine kinase